MRPRPSNPSSPRRAPKPLTGVELDLWKALIRVSQLLPRTLDDDLARQGASLAHYEILAVLAARPDGLRMGDLGSYALVSRPRLSVHVRQLEQDGLVARRPDPNDGRSTLVDITAAGRRRLRQLAPAHLAVAHDLIDRVSPTHHAPLLQALVALLDGLGDPWRPDA